MGIWIAVYSGLVPEASRWMALGFFPPYGFLLFILPSIVVFAWQQYRRVWRSLTAVFLLFFFLFGDFSYFKQPVVRFSETEQTQPLKVIALNLRYFSYGFETVVEAIREMDADLYLLSENSISVEQREVLEDRIQPKTFFMGRDLGTAIISRYPVLSFREIEFPTRQVSLHKGVKLDRIHLNPFRSFVHGILDVNGVKVHAISVRFIAGRPRKRTFAHTWEFSFHILEAQRKEIAFFLDYIQKLEGPVILGGDLNATASSITIRKLTRVATDLYLQDHVWGGFTFWTSFPAFARLDYLFGMNQVQPVRSERLDIVVSDHYPVVADVLIPRRGDCGSIRFGSFETGRFGSSLFRSSL